MLLVILLKAAVLLHIIFSKRHSHLEISVLIASTKLIVENMNKYLYDRNLKYHIENIRHQFYE